MSKSHPHHGLRPTALIVTALLLGCSAGQSKTVTADDEPATTKPPEEETDYERTVRLAKTKRADCDRLVDGVQAAQDKDNIVGINDIDKMKKLSKGIEQQADELDRVELSTEQLQKLRDKYVGLMNERAETMVRATGLSGPTQKQAARDLQGLSTSQQQVIEEINGFCGGEQPAADEPKR